MLPNKRYYVTSLIGIITIFFTLTLPAYAGDGALIVLKDGKEAVINDGYKNLVAAMRKRKKGAKGSSVVEINLDGNSFFIDAGEITALCRMPCRAFQMKKSK